MFFREKVKRSFLLTEVVVCLSLMIILLGSIGFWQLLVVKKHERHKEICKMFEDESLAYKRLRAVFGAIVGDLSLTPKEKTICSFIFDRGVYKVPALSGNVYGSLVYDEEEGVLSLVIQSQNSPDLVEESYLLSNVSSLTLVPIFNLNDVPLKDERLGMPSFITFNLSRKATKYTASRNFSFTVASGR
ncbi:DUF1494 domain-containing protein [Chlamydiifrater volucris]|uniref:DUF1494 domain-containing protein n=1 Tax=Chlamydiifrater volucris TaxID=2681470 RepID=UPI0024848561|nr:DUF1494 domain-containing protein [Chlamydiifrater volucris]